MAYLPYTKMVAHGESAARASLLFSRLEGPMYRTADIYSVESGGWPGDWEGRTILALTLLHQITGKEPAYLAEILEELPRHLNEKGYLRQVYENGELNEQQLSGHSWLLRGLCAAYESDVCEKPATVLSEIEAIVRNLFLPAIGKYRQYPIREEDRVKDGEASGHIGKKVGDWYLSSDTGCAYIPLDGLSHAYTVLDADSADRELVDGLRILLDEMTETFYKIPFLQIQAQTHATLTACRGLMRLNRHTPDSKKLAFVEKIFRMYIEHGMTANYANKNWFGRPEWTEPCAIIDSFILAAELYDATGDARYLPYVQKILYNGVYASERHNGGFGTDTCTGALEKAENAFLACSSYEAYWCCSMRGGEGLASVQKYALRILDESHAELLYPVSGVFTVGEKTIAIRTDYPADGETTIRVLQNSNDTALTLRVCLPESVETDLPKDRSITLYGEGTHRFRHTPVLHTETPDGMENCTDKSLLFAGSVILGISGSTKSLSCAEAQSLAQNWLDGAENTGIVPITERYLRMPELIQSEKLQILF